MDEKHTVYIHFTCPVVQKLVEQRSAIYLPQMAGSPIKMTVGTLNAPA